MTAWGVVIRWVMDLDTAADILGELGNPTRLSILRLLVRAGDEGLPVGEIQERIGIPASTLSHHISRLIRVELIEQRRDGRILQCRPRFEVLRDALSFVTAECCRGFDDGSCGS